MPTPTEVKSTTDAFLQNEDTVLNTGNDGSTPLKATAIAQLALSLIYDGTGWQRLKQAVVGSITNLAGIINVIGLGRYNATPPTLTDGDHRSLQLDANANLKTTVAAPLPAGANTIGTVNLGTVGTAATEATLNAIKTLLQGDVAFSESIWTDDTGTFYIRRVEFNEETNSYSYAFALPNGSAYTPTTNPRPASTVSDFEIREERFLATTGGTGYSTGDIIGLVVFYNVTASPPTIASSVWTNITLNTTISAPLIGNLQAINKAQAVTQQGTWTVQPGNTPNTAPWLFRQTANTSTTAITTTRGIKTVASSGTPEPLVGTSTLVQKVLITPQKAARTANSGVVYIDFVGTDDAQAIALSLDSAVIMAVSSIQFEAPAGKKIDLNAIYVDVATNGDGVYYLGID